MDTLAENIDFAVENLEDKSLVTKIKRIMCYDALDATLNTTYEDSSALEHVIAMYKHFAISAVAAENYAKAYDYQFFISRHLETLLKIANGK